MAQATDPVTGRPATRPVLVTGESDDPQAIADDIRETRADLSDTISAIGDKLDPSHMIDSAKDALFSAGRDAGSSVIDQVKSSSVLDTIKDNPLPAMAVGLSLAWFISKVGESESERYRRDQFERTGDPYYAPRYGDRYRAYDMGFPNPSQTRTAGGHDDSLLDTAKDKASDAVGAVKDAASSVGDKAASLADRAGDAVSGAASGIGGSAQGAGRQAQHYGRRAENWMEQQLRSNPLAVGAVALAAGALVGLSVPETDAEHRAFGDQADQAKRQLADAAQDAAQTVKDKAQDVADEAADKAKSVGKKAEAKAKDVGATAKDKADDVADQAKADIQKAKPGTPKTKGTTTGTTSRKV